MLSVGLQVISRLLVVKFWGIENVYKDFLLYECEDPNLCIVEGSAVQHRLQIVYLSDHMAGWELRFTTIVLNHERLSFSYCQPRKSSKLEVWFPLTTYHFCTTVKMKNRKWNDHKLGNLFSSSQEPATVGLPSEAMQLIPGLPLSWCCFSWPNFSQPFPPQITQARNRSNPLCFKILVSLEPPSGM